MKNGGDICHQIINRQAVGKPASTDFFNKKVTTSTDMAVRSAGSISAISCAVSAGLEMRGITVIIAFTSISIMACRRVPRSAPDCGLRSTISVISVLPRLMGVRMEYSPDEYQNLLMCEFVDDLASVFPLSELQACMVDSWEVWTDFHALALRPFGWREVWIGYDPAKGTQNGDSAGCVVVAPPAVPGGKFRILERHQWRGMDFRAQADAIKKLTEQYNVTYIGIDSTGVGHGVYENVKAFFPAVREFVYNPNVKNALVLKAYDIISHRRLEFDAGHTDIAQSFMAIRRATTASGNRPTYEASRSEEASHADLAWATMHALFNEPLQGESANTSNIVEIF